MSDSPSAPALDFGAFQTLAKALGVAVHHPWQVLSFEDAATILGPEPRTIRKLHGNGILQGPKVKPYKVYAWSVMSVLATPHRPAEPDEAEPDDAPAPVILRP